MRRKSVERSLVHGTSEALPLPDKPSIAVLAFTNMSGDPEQEYFSDGIADDIITELVAQPFAVCHRSQLQLHLQGACGRHEAGRSRTRRALRARRQRASQRRAAFGLSRSLSTLRPAIISGLSGTIAHSSDVFAVQDEITAAVARAILPAVSDAEQRRILRKPPESLGAWEAYQRGLWHMGKGNPAENARAQHFFGQAIQGDRSFASAHSAMAMAVLLDGIYGKFPTTRRFVQGSWATRKRCCRN